MDPHTHLTRRERQIMDIIYTRGQASISDVLTELPNPPARGALGRLINILEEKGHLKHHRQGRQFIYQPTLAPSKAGPSALRRVIETFYHGSLRNALAAHLAQRDTQLSEDDLKHLAQLIRQARNKGK